MEVFVYGALMDEPDLQRDGRAGWLDDHETRFTARGFTWLEPRFLALQVAPGHRAHGLVATVDEARWQAMSAHEDGYSATDVVVQTSSGPVEAITLLLDPDQRVPPALPSGRYADRLVRGATAVGLPDEVIARYRAASRDGSPITRWMTPVVGGVRRWLASTRSR